MKVSTLLRCVRMLPNGAGRDFVVGDLHGHRALLEGELLRLRFDVRRDRLFSVGDLVDRGPDSMATLALLEEPWFHAVIGNHELMLLNYLGFYGSRQHGRRSFANGVGAWVVAAQARHRERLHRLAEQVALLPLARHVSGTQPFNVLHGDLAPMGYSQAALLRQAAVCVHEAELATASRDNVAGLHGRPLMPVVFGGRPVQVSEAALGPLPLTYVGHSRLRDVTVHNSHVYVDQGVMARKAVQRPPTVLEHLPFAWWVRGAARAHADHGPDALAA